MPNPNRNVPTEGKKAPAFALPSQSGDKVRLSSLKGAPVVLYFYPKDNTPGCTVEAQEFRDSMESGLTPITSAPALLKSGSESRNSWASTVQPGVLSLG